MKTPEEIREALTGPIASIRPPFQRDGSLNLAGLERYIDFTIDAGSRTMLLTFGDSLFSTLTDGEVEELTRSVIEFTAGRALVVAADRQWWTGRTVEFAKNVRELGADVLMVLPPDWGRSCTPETMVRHYAAVAEQIPVMVVTNVFIARGIPFGLKTLELALEVGNIVAVKDDFCGEFARRMAALVHERWAVFAGGQKQNHLNMLPYGCDGYLSTFVAFKPEITHRYWGAVQAGDLAAAAGVINDYDVPLFNYICAQTGGFCACLHATLELFGIAERWRRPPYYTLSDEEMERLRRFYEGLGLL